MRVRAGFTLGALLAVIAGIALIATIASLLLTSLAQVQEAAVRCQAICNLKQVACAAHGFNDQHGKLPRALDYFAATKRLTTPLGQLAPYYEINFKGLTTPGDYSFTGPQVVATPGPDPLGKNPFTSIAGNYYAFGAPTDGDLPTTPTTSPHGTALAIKDIADADGTSNVLLFATCFAICRDGSTTVEVRLNEPPGSAGSPFLSRVNYGAVDNWQAQPDVQSCDQTPGKRAQSFFSTGIQVSLCDGCIRTLPPPNHDNPIWNALLRPNDGIKPQWD